jgi:hypothetical protein
MKKIFFLLCLFAYGMVNGQATGHYYKVLTGDIMGTEGTVYLHVSPTSTDGYLLLKKDPRPFIIFNGSLSDDSLKLYGYRSPQLSLIIEAKFKNAQADGNARMELDNRIIRKGKTLLKEDHEGRTAFDFYSREGTAHLPASLKNESTCLFAASAVWPKENDVLSKKIKSLAASFFEQPAGKEPAAMFTSMQQKLFNTWKKNNVKLGAKETAEMGLSLSVEDVRRLYVMSENKQVLVLAEYSSEYSGGAHNMTNTTLIALDRNSGKQLKLADVLSAAGIKALPALLDKAARAQFGIKNTKPLDQNEFQVKTILVSENFYLTETGIGFLYNPYEIKSFADGEITLFIPFATIARYVQPAFLKP